MKTRKSVIKRFKITKNGKILRRKNFSRHLRVTKSASKKRQQRKQVEMKGYYGKKLRKALGIRKTHIKKVEGK